MVTDGIKTYSIAVKDILDSSRRLEASVFNIKAREYKDKILKCGFPLESLTSKNIILSASYPGRFKRNYVSHQFGMPFILPSQITEVNPRPNKWILGLSPSMIEDLSVNKGDILLTRSGTVGQCSIATDNLAGKIMSDDLIRIRAIEKYKGYIYTFLYSKCGQTLLSTSNYGAVIQHIEPDHLTQIKLPIPPKAILEEICSKIDKSFDYRNKSNKLIAEADEKLLKRLNLGDLSDKDFNKSFSKDVLCFQAKYRDFKGRLEASFHNPTIGALLKNLSKTALDVVTIGSEQVSKEIILPGRFKRNYVGEDFGVPFLGGKEINNLDPRTGKFLSFDHHQERIKKQLCISEHQVLITCSGTIGKVNIAPKHWDGWASSQHMIRIESKDARMAGYLYIWLNSNFGRLLVKRFIYGSVVQEIDNKHVAQVSVPILETKIMNEIGDLVLEANKLRHKAFLLEQEALEIFDRKVLKE